MNLDDDIVLRLNSGWIPCGVSSIREAITAMNSGDEFDDGVKAAIGIDMQFVQNENGEWDFDSPNPVPTKWEDWINLPIREFDQFIQTAKAKIRVPTVIICPNYDKIPHKHKKPTAKNIRERDGNRCQYSGRLLGPDEGNLEHIMPRSRGGQNTWENLAWADKNLNSLKGDRTPEEMGWTLIRTPAAPRVVPVSTSIRILKHRDWKIFAKYLDSGL